MIVYRELTRVHFTNYIINGYILFRFKKKEQELFYFMFGSTVDLTQIIKHALYHFL